MLWMMSTAVFLSCAGRTLRPGGHVRVRGIPSRHPGVRAWFPEMCWGRGPFYDGGEPRGAPCDAIGPQAAVHKVFTKLAITSRNQLYGVLASHRSERPRYAPNTGSRYLTGPAFRDAAGRPRPGSRGAG
jgi:hypothetical protein